MPKLFVTSHFTFHLMRICFVVSILFFAIAINHWQQNVAFSSDRLQCCHLADGSSVNHMNSVRDNLVSG